MNIIGLNSFVVILNYGALILISFLLTANPIGVNKKANLWFGAFLFLWSTFWLEEIFTFMNTSYHHSPLSLFIYFIQMLTPIVFYFSIEYYTNPEYKFKKIDLLYIALPLTFLIVIITNNNRKLILNLFVVLIIIQSLYFIISSYIKLKHHKKKILLFSSNTREIDLKWIEYIIIALLVLSVFIGLYNAILVSSDLNLFANIVSVVIIFFVAYNALKQKEIFLINENQRRLVIEVNQETTVEKRKIISESDLKKLKSTLVHLMDNQQPFLGAELSLVRLAELINISPHQLSYVLNTGFNENFFQFVNRYRVEKVKELLLNKEKNHLSFLGIAFESGFNSKTTFNTTFKKLTSETPSEYKKNRSSL